VHGDKTVIKLIMAMAGIFRNINNDVINGIRPHRSGNLKFGATVITDYMIYSQPDKISEITTLQEATLLKQKFKVWLLRLFHSNSIFTATQQQVYQSQTYTS
jgi:hypothetical protein